MNMTNCLCCGAAALLFASCSVHPLPEQAEGSKTTAIVTKIRCEARRAIEDIPIDRLKKLAARNPNLRRDYDLAERLRAERDNGENFVLQDVTKTLPEGTIERKFYDDYIKSGIAFNFTFDITESDKNDSEFDFGKIVGTGSGILAVKANADLSREGTRHFIVSDTFEGLLMDSSLNMSTERQVTHCPSQYPLPNIVFPVTGDIGLNEVISTFVDLNTAEVLNSAAADKATATTDAASVRTSPAKPTNSKSPKTDAKKDDDSAHNVPVLADTLVFISTFEGSINPMVTLMPGKHAGLTKATFLGDHTRTDKNTVIVGLSYKPIKGPAVAARPLLLAGISPVGSSSTATVFAHKTNSTAEDRAIDATIEQQYNTFVQTRGLLGN